jgi:hypothetical protein
MWCSARVNVIHTRARVHIYICYPALLASVLVFVFSHHLCSHVFVATVLSLARARIFLSHVRVFPPYLSQRTGLCAGVGVLVVLMF